MKKYLLLLGVMAAIISIVLWINPRCNLTDTDPTSRSETTITVGTTGDLQTIVSQPKKRYFFIGYDIRHKQNFSYGNWYMWCDTLPSYESLKKQAAKNFLGDVNGATMENLVITSIYEFKDSIEYNSFRVGLKSNQYLK